MINFIITTSIIAVNNKKMSNITMYSLNNLIRIIRELYKLTFFKIEWIFSSEEDMVKYVNNIFCDENNSKTRECIMEFIIDNEEHFKNNNNIVHFFECCPIKLISNDDIDEENIKKLINNIFQMSKIYVAILEINVQLKRESNEDLNIKKKTLEKKYIITREHIRCNIKSMNLFDKLIKHFDCDCYKDVYTKLPQSKCFINDTFLCPESRLLWMIMTDIDIFDTNIKKYEKIIGEFIRDHKNKNDIVMIDLWNIMISPSNQVIMNCFFDNDIYNIPYSDNKQINKQKYNNISQHIFDNAIKILNKIVEKSNAKIICFYPYIKFNINKFNIQYNENILCIPCTYTPIMLKRFKTKYSEMDDLMLVYMWDKFYDDVHVISGDNYDGPINELYLENYINSKKFDSSSINCEIDFNDITTCAKINKKKYINDKQLELCFKYTESIYDVLIVHIKSHFFECISKKYINSNETESKKFICDEFTYVKHYFITNIKYIYNDFVNKKSYETEFNDSFHKKFKTSNKSDYIELKKEFY